ncbi:MAG: diguanylate cyclase [Alkalimonas sp.]|nr:diguanylate cyclase [Alkalimonas sp.]
MVSSKKTGENQQRYVVLQQRFIGTLCGKATRLLEATRQLAEGEDTQLAAVIADSHQLAGSCGTFGLHELGKAARQIEQLALGLEKSPTLKQRHLRELVAKAEHFTQSVDSLISGGVAEKARQPVVVNETNQLWLLLDNQKLKDELSSQLSAFDYQIRAFSDFDACLLALKQESPALVYCTLSLDSDDSTVFEHTDLLEALQVKGIPWMLYTTTDDFDLRIQAARYQARAFYVSPLDIPAMLGRITELMQLTSQQKGRVCIMDDDALLAEHYALTLQAAGIDCMVLTEPKTIIQDILHFQPELILMDLHMPTYTGPELAGVIRQHDALKSLPIVYLSAEQDQAQQLKAMAFGADDFLTKPISEQQLVKAVKVRLTRSRELRDLIEKDSLTGLIKHSAIKEAAQLEFERSKRSDKHFSLVMLDIDHFKAVNDQYGHAIGDVVITTLATLLQQRIRRTDKAGRYGGEEFVLVLPECSSDDALLMLQAMLDSFRSIAFHALGHDFHCSFSAGIACSDSGFPDSETMLNAADEKLYQAKSLGRNRVIA